MPVKIVSPQNAANFYWEAEGFLRLRHHIYVEKRGWVPAQDGMRERDQYDDFKPTYALYVDAGGAIRAGVRLHCSTYGTMVDECFAESLTPAPEHSPQLWEASRLALSPTLGDASEWTILSLIEASVGWLIHQGARELLAFSTPLQHRVFRRFGVEPVRRGEMLRHLSSPGYTAIYRLDAALLAGLRTQLAARNAPSLLEPALAA